MPAPTPSIIPQPHHVQPGDGQFVINDKTDITATPAEILPIGYYLAELLRPATGYSFFTHTGSPRNAIRLALTDEIEGEEAYTLEVTQTGVDIRARTPRGVFYGVQTLRQLLPIAIEKDTLNEGAEWSIPFITIKDAPRFGWRGLHLDVGRHFFDVTFVKKFIDTMALYKFNVFHWHLTEDQGWRIQIKQYPKLTRVGAKRTQTPIPANRQQGDGVPYEGHYTQKQIREVVEYAAARYITVVPEIEMPGHALAALASYPKLGCVGEGYEVRTSWGIAEDVFCAGKEETFTFLENVLTEVLDLFPSEFIHIGGDECPKVRWENCPHCQARIEAEGLADEYELQSYFIRRIERFLNEHGRRLIGWDEILEGGLAPNATVMSWRGSAGGIDAANAGHDVVMSPTTHCYFDYYQSENHASEPPAIGGYLPLETVYEFNPIPEDIAPDKAHHVLGGQGNIWTEYIPTTDQLEYMAYPRALALAEAVWSYPQQRDFADFRPRLTEHLGRLDALGVNYRALD